MNGVNLIPAYRLGANRRAARVRMWLCIAPVCVSVLAGSYGYFMAVWDTRTSDLRRQLDGLDARISAADKAAAAARAEAAKVESRIRAQQTVSGQPDWGRLLRIIAGKLGDRAVLSSIVLEPRDPPPAAGGKPPVSEPIGRPVYYRLTLAGAAREQQDATALAVDLDALRLFEKVTPVENRRSTFRGDSAVAFRIECAVAEAIPENR